MGVRGIYYGGIVLDGLVFHIDAAKQESYAKRGLRYMQNGNSNLFIDFADTSKSPSTENATGTIINGVTFSNFAPYHLSTTPYWHNPATTAWKDSAGIGTFYGNLEFDGVNDYVSFGSTPEMDGIKDITVSAWFYVNKFKSGAVPAGGTTSIIASRYNGVNGWALGYNNQGVVYFDGRESGAEYLSVTASIPVKSSNSTTNGGWYNAVGTKQGSVWSIYVAETNRYIVDGDRSIYVAAYQQSLLGTRTMGVGTTTFTTNNLYLGCVVFGTPTLHMDGRLMSLSVYNRALSLSEINQNYDSVTKRIIKNSVPASPEFITKWNTSIPIMETATGIIEIPINPSYTYNYTVDWGDGITTTGHTGNATHTYATNGIYTVKITGTFPAIFTSNNIYKVRMIEVSQWGTNVWQTMESAFYECSNMNVTATDAPNLSVVTNMFAMFRGCISMNGNISSWDVSNVTRMIDMFSQATSFNQPLNSWNVSAVTEMQGMFAGATSFNMPLYSWNTMSVISMAGMFGNAVLFNQNISAWNTSAVTEMQSMFDGATDFNNGGQPMLTSGNSWNTSAVTDMSTMFYQASSFNANISNWNTANVTNMGAMFYEASVFNSNISSWNTVNVTAMYSMFFNAYSFNRPIGSWNTANVTGMGSMFWGATLFNQNISAWNTAAVVDMSGMFFSSAFNNGGQPMPTNGNSWNTSSVQYMSNMFNQATNFNQNIATWNTLSVISMRQMFYGASAFNNGGQPMPTNGNSWNTTNVTDMWGMFSYTTNFNQNIATWNTANVTTMGPMFNGSIFNNGGQPIPRNGSSWNTALVTDMNSMFYMNDAFNQNIGTWNVSNVTDFTNFMSTKTPTTLSTANLDAIYIGWVSRPVKPNIIISFGTANRTSASTSARNALIVANLWTITDGGI